MNNRAFAAVLIVDPNIEPFSAEISHQVIAGNTVASYLVGALARAGATECMVLGCGEDFDLLRKGFKQTEAGMPVSFLDSQVDFRGEPLSDCLAFMDIDTFNSDVFLASINRPMITTDFISEFLAEHRNAGAGLSIRTASPEPTDQFGHVLRDEKNNIAEVIDYNFAQTLGLVDESSPFEATEGIVFMKADLLSSSARRANPLSSSVSISDLVAVVAASGNGVHSYESDVLGMSESQAVRNMAELAEAGQIMRSRINASHMTNGVQIVDPATTYIDTSVEIAEGSKIWPNTYLTGDTKVGRNCVVGPNVLLNDCVLEDESEVVFATAEGAKFASRSKVSDQN